MSDAARRLVLGLPFIRDAINDTVNGYPSREQPRELPSDESLRAAFDSVRQFVAEQPTRPGRAELIEGVRLNIVDLANMLRLSAERPQSIIYDPIRLLGDIKDQCERGIKLLEEL